MDLLDTEVRKLIPTTRFTSVVPKALHRRSRMVKRARRGKILRLIVAILAIQSLSLGIPTVQDQTAAQEFPNKTSVKKVATNLNGFGIPFNIDANDDSFIEVQLYLSEDRGRTWRFHDRQSTDNKEFPFQAKADGEYWFSLKTLDRNRRLIPPGKTLPELIILIDTVKPKLKFQIETDPAGRVVCRWQARDAHLDTDSFQIEYKPTHAPDDGWSIVPVKLDAHVRNGVYADQVAWWPQTTERDLIVRMAISDTAGNRVTQDRHVIVPATPWRHRSQSIALPTRSKPNPASPTPASDSHLTPYRPKSQPSESFPAETLAPQTKNHVASRKPVCKNGVCQIPKRNTAATDKKPNTPIPNSHAQDRFANSGGNIVGPKKFSWVGSPPVFAAPPVPPGYKAPLRVAQNNNQPPPAPRQQPETNGFRTAQAPSPQTSNNSVAWSSQPQRYTPDYQSSSSSTLRPDPRVLPSPLMSTKGANSNESTQNQETRSSLPSPNPNPTKRTDKHFVSESTTAGTANQYRGLNNYPAKAEPHPSRNVPREEAENWVVDESYQPDGKYFQANSSVLRSPKINRSNRANLTERSDLASVVDNRASSEPVDNSSLQMIGSKRFRLNYGIDAIDPSGVAKVDLWMTRDGGQSWKLWGADPDQTSPFPVEVQEEGRYGFRIVVHSRDGLTGTGPSAGDTPDIWVHVDTQSPLSQITSVPYGRGKQAGRLIINYRVADPWLVLRPVTLAWSRNPAGPWTPIAEGLRNEGRYAWKPNRTIPDRIFLRLEARDRAGNLGVHQLSQAIDVSGLIPRGTIHGVTPVGIE